MFKTYQDSLGEIEALYNDKQYNATIVDCAKLTEKAVGVFFNHFHTFLKTRDENLKYLEFEKESGEKFQSFLKKPTIGVGIGYYNQLLGLFPNKPGLNQDIRGHLNTINNIRNAHVHSHDASPTSPDEAGQMLDAMEKILKSTSLLKASVDMVGVPLKYYLVFKSIESKFDRSDTEDDFKKIVNDASKVIPHLIDVLLNKTYHSLSIPQKEKLIDLYFSTDRKERSLSDYYKLCQQVGVFETLDRSDILRESMEEISNEQDVYSRRLTRHFVNAIQVIIELTENPHAHHFLEYANSVKRRYLRSRKLSENDRMILQEKASESGISKDLARRIEEAVVETIDRDLILYQTLTEDSSTGEEPKQGSSVRPSRTKNRTIAIVALPAIILVSAAVWFFFPASSRFEDYEAVYLEFNTKKAIELADKKRDLKNVNANFYYILANYFEHQYKIPDEVKADYVRMLHENPSAPEAHFYLGMIYTYYSRFNQQQDSAYLLLMNAREMGLTGIEADLILYEFYAQHQLQSFATKLVDMLASYNHPRTKLIAGSVYLDIKRDTLTAIRLLRESIKAYEKYINPYLSLARIYTKRKQLDSARTFLETARGIRSEDPQVVEALASLYKEEGRFDKAKQLYREAVEGFGADRPDYYHGLAYILFLEDSIQQSSAVVESGLNKFPKEQTLLFYKQMIERRKKSFEKKTQNKDSIRWFVKMEEASAAAQQLRKPVLLYLYTPGDWANSTLERMVFNDSVVIEAMRNFVAVKINPELNPQIKKKFELDFLPQFLILNESGDEIGKVARFFNPSSFSEALHSEHTKLVRFAALTNSSETFMEVNNFVDARLIATNRNIPIMLVVGDKRSKYTKKFLSESFADPLFKVSFRNLVYLYLNENSNDPVLGTLGIKSYPSTFFFDSNAKLISSLYGSMPGKALATRLNEIKEAIQTRTRLARSINWFYDFQEAQAYSLLTKKYLFMNFSLNSCEDCHRMNKVLSDSSVINRLEKDYVSVYLSLDEKPGMQKWREYDVFFLPSQIILDQNGQVIAQNGGMLNAAEFKEWLDIRAKTRLVSILGVKDYIDYNEKYMLGKTMATFRLYKSSRKVLLPLNKTISDDPDVLKTLAEVSIGLKNNDQAIEYYEQSIASGLKPNYQIITQIIRAFIQAGKLDQSLDWFSNHVKSSAKSKDQSAFYLFGLSMSAELLADYPKAYELSKQLVAGDSKIKEAYMQAIRLGIKNEKIKEAETFVTKARVLFPNDAEFLFYKGLIAEKSGNVSAKNTAYKSAISSNNNVGWLVSFNQLLYTDNFQQYDGVRDLIINGYENSTRVNTTNSHLARNGWLIYTIEGRYSESLTAINKAIDLDPSNKFLSLYKSFCLYKIGQEETASMLASEAEKDLAEETLTPEDYLALAVSKVYLKKMEEAKRYLNKAIHFPEPEAIHKPFQKMAQELLNTL